MCGLVGIAGALEFKDEATMKRLFLLDYFRGPDSTGFAAIRGNGDIKMAKGAINPIDLFDTGKFKEALSGHNSIVFMGHNRMATRGAVNNLNAHPFAYGNIIGAHNGTLETKDRWALEDAVGEKFDVDSMALFAAIDKLGVDAAIGMCHEGRDSQTGAWALTWWNKDDGTINFLRNKHRPLFYAFSKNFKHVFWASEWPMIDNAIKMSTTGYELFADENGHSFFPFEPDTHYKFEVNVFKLGSETRPKPKVKAVKGKEEVAVKSASDPFGRGSHSSGTRSQGPSNSVTTSKKNTSTTNHSHTHISAGKKVKTVHLIGNLENPFAGYYPQKDWDIKFGKNGCQWCDKDVAFEDPSITVFHRDNVLLCSKCSGNGEQSHETENPPPTRIYLPAKDLEAMQ